MDELFVVMLKLVLVLLNLKIEEMLKMHFVILMELLY